MDQSIQVQRSLPDDDDIIDSIFYSKELSGSLQVYHAALRRHSGVTTPLYLAMHFDRDTLMTARFGFEAAIRDMCRPMIVDDVIKRSRVIDMIKESLTPEDSN